FVGGSEFPDLSRRERADSLALVNPIFVTSRRGGPDAKTSTDRVCSLRSQHDDSTTANTAMTARSDSSSTSAGGASMKSSDSSSSIFSSTIEENGDGAARNVAPTSHASRSQTLGEQHFVNCSSTIGSRACAGFSS
ncbi:unnamed protein product, partial [Amoebophrya sp. A25]